MLNLHRVARLLDRVFPSVSPVDQAILLGAMEGRDLETPVPMPFGEGGVGTGLNVASTSLVGGGERPESVVPRHPAALSGPPSIETDLFWEPATESRWEFGETRLGRMLDRWTKESSA